MKNVIVGIVLTSFGATAPTYAFNESIDCSFCGAGFCAEIEPTFRVTASRPKKSVISYRVTGPDFVLILEEGEKDQLEDLRLHTPKTVDPLYPNYIGFNLGNAEMTKQINVICYSEHLEKCHSLVTSKLHLHDERYTPTGGCKARVLPEKTED